ncbi:oligosaccharide flippase family protein [Alkalihalobacterium bogoriense]|uniref:oligosaccharide flippase family protein n=1 Tax=Alkalihalobacterium bogoriense TaxID=246272 RepID=UPI00047E6E61|nr:oligosaccharide flippase family protein [Alkalihalobacterium bogoriense]
MKINQLKFGIYLSYISLFISNITNLILTPFIIRNLGQSEYGLYMLIGAFVGYIAVLDFGLSNATVRFVAKYRAENNKKEEENFLFSTLIIYSIISFIVLVIGTIIYLNLDSIFRNSLTSYEIEIAKVMFIVLVITLALTLPMNLFKGIITAYERFIFDRVLTICRLLLRTIIILILLSLGYKAIAIVLIDAIFNVIMMLLSMLYVFLKLNVRIRMHRINISVVKEIFSYSSLIFISVVVDQIYWRIGHLVLGIVASTSEVAIFAIGMVIGLYFITFSTAISGVFLPKITKMVVNNASGEELTDLLIKTGRLQLLIIGLVLGIFSLFGSKFILLWAGPGFETSWIIAMIVMIPLVVVLSQTVGISILQAKNMHGFRAVAYLCISFVNVFLSIYLARIFGAVGTAIGTSLSLIIGNIFAMNVYYHYKVGLNIPRFFKEVYKKLIIAILGSICIGVLLLLIPGVNWITLILQCALYSFIYFLIMWFFGMNKYEKDLFLNEINKVIKLFSIFKSRYKQTDIN